MPKSRSQFIFVNQQTPISGDHAHSPTAQRAARVASGNNSTIMWHFHCCPLLFVFILIKKSTARMQKANRFADSHTCRPSQKQKPKKKKYKPPIPCVRIFDIYGQWPLVGAKLHPDKHLHHPAAPRGTKRSRKAPQKPPPTAAVVAEILQIFGALRRFGSQLCKSKDRHTAIS